MFRNAITVTLIALVTLTSSFIAPREASASSQATEAARRAATRAHNVAQSRTQQVARVQASYASEAAKFNAGAASSDYNTRYYAKRSFIMYLRGLQTAIRKAISAHQDAIRRWELYNRRVGSGAANGSILALGAAIRRFQATLNQAQVDINRAGNVR